GKTRPRSRPRPAAGSDPQWEVLQPGGQRAWRGRWRGSAGRGRPRRVRTTCGRYTALVKEAGFRDGRERGMSERERDGETPSGLLLLLFLNARRRASPPQRSRSRCSRLSRLGPRHAWEVAGTAPPHDPPPHPWLPPHRPPHGPWRRPEHGPELPDQRAPFTMTEGHRL